MDELEAIAFSKVKRRSVGHVAWDFHNLGVFNADMSHYMESSPEFNHHHHHHHSFVDDECDHFSTGYLQDVLVEFSSKRRRLSHSHSSIKNCWTSTLIQNFMTTLTQMSTKCNTISDMAELKSGEEANSDSSSISTSSQTKESADNQWTPEKQNLFCIDPIFSSRGIDDKRKRRVVYPFAVVKPGGFEGDATLNDINKRILMPPTWPVRHPVGDFACRPLVSPYGRGLSGKAVVAFTRIQTQGRGTITIIRTRG